MALLSSSAVTGSAGAARNGASLVGTLVRLWPGALAGAIALLACSSSSDRPPQLGACVPTHDIMCGSPTTAGGGGTPASDAAASDSGTEIVGEGGSCTGATEIFGTAAPSCVSCVTASCCGAASCPNDPNCVSIAVCVTQTCLANNTSCLPTCEGAAPTATGTEYISFQQCVGENCPGCPALAPGDL